MRRYNGLRSDHLPLRVLELTAVMNDKQKDLNQQNNEPKKEHKRLRREPAQKEKRPFGALDTD